MSEIVYLLGAGASAGDNNREGLPVVSTIPSHLTSIITKIEECECSENNKNIIFPIGRSWGIGFNKAKDVLLDDLRWLKNECENHATIDTFAKKLYLKRDYDNFYKVESLLAIFFIIEQVINKKDSRYDTFLASVLNSNLEIDDKITILTWNYDSQFELAYKEYGENKDSLSIRNKLGIIDLKKQENSKAPQIFKLNGSANFKDNIYLSTDPKFDETLLNNIFDIYTKSIDNKFKDSLISFAWDNDKFLTLNFREAIKNAIGDAKTLVIIGYTFPFFNRDVDRMLFDFMPNLKKIYIQDPNASQIIQNLEPVLSVKNYNLNELKKNIIPKTNTDQFFLPPEL